MAKHLYVDHCNRPPATGYYVEVDIAGVPDNRMAVHLLRDELNPIGIHVKVLEGPGGGNPLVRLSSVSCTRLEAWLVANDYELDVHRVGSRKQ